MNAKLPYQNPERTDANLDTEVVYVEGHAVHRERIQIAGKGEEDIAPVDKTKGLKVYLNDNTVVIEGVASEATLLAIISALEAIDFATSAKQLPDNHQVEVSNFPNTQLVSANDLPLPAGAATEVSQLKMIGFNANSNITTTVVTAGAVKTITETDGVKTLTTVIDSTDPLNKSIISTWS